MKVDPLGLSQVPAGASTLAAASHRLSRKMRDGLAKMLKQRAGLSLPAWRIYVGLAESGSATQKQLVQFTQIEQSHISRALAQLENDGAIVSGTSKADKRARIFALTAQGREQFDALLPYVQAYADAMDSALTAAEQAQFLAMVERLAGAVSDATI